MFTKNTPKVGSLGMRYLLWQGPSSPKASFAPMTAPVCWSQQALGWLFRRATPDPFHSPAHVPSERKQICS